MKIAKKILLAISIIIIVVGMFVLGRYGFNYANGYTKNILLETAKHYKFVASLSTAIILVYYVIRYNKQGVLKVLATSILGILGTLLFALAVIAIVRMPVTKIFFPIILTSYVLSIIALSANFEENT